MDEIRLVVASEIPTSPARKLPPSRPPLRVAAVQQRWRKNPEEHQEALAEGIALAAGEGARLVCLQELTLSPYFASNPQGPRGAGIEAEPLPGGPTHRFAAQMAGRYRVYVHASLFERAAGDGDERGYNTAILVAPDGELIGRTRKLHIPVTAGYHEDRYFRPGPGPDESQPFPVFALEEAKLGLPTCWDQWFPEVARAYSLEGTDILVYPTAIGSEPDHPDFDTQPLWERVIVANGIVNGVFMVAVNRVGSEPPITFYGSSFISDETGAIVADAPRDKEAVITHTFDLEAIRRARASWGLYRDRRPDLYGGLLKFGGGNT